MALGTVGAGRVALLSLPAGAAPWTPRTLAALTVLAAAAFVYVTAEILPVGALPAIAADLRVSEALVGTLLAGYALVAAVTTVPLVRLTAAWPRRRTLLLALGCLTASQLISAVAPTFAVLAAGRILCALTHGLLWAIIAPIAARLVPPTHAGRATTAVFAGTALALVVGNPLTAAMSQVWGWRTAVLVVTAVAAAVTIAARLALPALPALAGATGDPTRRRHHRDARLVTLSVLTLIGVTGHFLSYTFIVPVIRDVVGVRGPQGAWLLAAFGVAGLAAMAAFAGPADRRPRAAVLAELAVLVAVFGTLALLAGAPVTVIGVIAITCWGAASTALPPVLQAAVMRAAPDDPDGASGLYVTAFQIGIMAGASGGGLLYELGGLTAMTAGSAVLSAVALIGVAAVPGLFAIPPVSGRK